MNTPGVHYPHRIRLRGPWQSESLAGGARRRRRFGYPGRIDADERVWLTFGGVSGRVTVSLNGQPLGAHAGAEPFEYEVTRLLAPRNELVMEWDGMAEAAGDVALEVRRTAFLRGIAARHGAGRVHVGGEVVGCAARPLELYVLLDGHTIRYATVEPSAEGRRFEVVADGTGRQVRVELIDGATVWYAVAVII